MYQAQQGHCAKTFFMFWDFCNYDIIYVSSFCEISDKVTPLRPRSIK